MTKYLNQKCFENDKLTTAQNTNTMQIKHLKEMLKEV